jgi:hypothetical protein
LSQPHESPATKILDRDVEADEVSTLLCVSLQNPDRARFVDEANRQGRLLRAEAEQKEALSRAHAASRSPPSHTST